MKRKLLTLIGATMTVIMLSGCKYEKPGTTSGTMYCDSSFENIIRQEIAVFENIYPKAVIGCRYRTQEEVIDSLLDGKTQLIVSGRELTNSERRRLETNQDTKKYFRSMQIAVDAMALIVNNDNPVSMLSEEEVAKILRGELTSWKQIQPDAPDIPIQVVVDNPNSGVTGYMREKMIGGGAFNPKSVVDVGSIQKVFETVKERRGVIGVIGVSWLTSGLQEPIPVDSIVAQLRKDKIEIDGGSINEKVKTSGVKTIRIITENGSFQPLQEHIYTGDYPYTRPVYMITTAHPSTTAGKFYAYVTSSEGQALIIRSGVMPARYERPIYEIK